jgi:Zn2+/Cd2+-exporting ATPase
MKEAQKTKLESVDWTNLLAAFLNEERKVRAIRLSPSEHKISLSTIGEIDQELLQEKLNDILKELEGKHAPVTGSSNSDQAHTNYTVRELATDEFLFERNTCPTAPAIAKWREFSWPTIDELEQRSLEEWQELSIQAAICGSCLLVAWVLDYFHAPNIWTISFYLISLIAGAWDAAKDTWEKIREGGLDIHFLMLAVALGAVSIGAWSEGALLLFLFSLSGALEHYALHRTHKEISALTKAAPKFAWLIKEKDRIEQVLVSKLVVGNLIQVRPDEIFPVDGVIESGESAADESTLTGESSPVTKRLGAKVFSGTLNLWGALNVRVDRLASQSALQKIISLIQNAQQSKAPSQRFTDRFGTGYTWLVLGITFTMFLYWTFVAGLQAFHAVNAADSAFYKSMTLLVVMSPCALALSIPSAILAAIAWGARHGILFRGGAAVEKLAEVDLVAMDKTGTLTEGHMHVARVESFPAGHEDKILRVAVALESNSNHPIARAIVAYGQEQGVLASAAEIEDFKSITAQGLRGKVSGELSYVGKRELLNQPGFDSWLTQIPDAPLGFTEAWVLSSNVLGRLLLHDQVREGSKKLLSDLSNKNIRTVMLTGDRHAAAQEIAKELGLDEVKAGLKPEDKVSIIESYAKSGKKVAMIGDGVNDAPSLAAAYVSVAMGARGSDAALEQSDVVLMQDKIEKFLSALRLSEKSGRVIKQNLFISLSAIVLMAFAAVFGLIPLSVGVLVHEGSTVVVCMNSLRLLFLRDS